MQDTKHSSLEILNIIGGILTGLISITGLCFSIYSFIVSNQTQEKIAQVPYQRYVTMAIGEEAVYYSNDRIRVFLTIELINTGNMNISFKELQFRKKYGEFAPGDKSVIPNATYNSATDTLEQTTSLDHIVLAPGERIKYWVELDAEDLDILQKGTVVLIDWVNGEHMWMMPVLAGETRDSALKSKSRIIYGPPEYKTFEIKVPRPE